ncbi:APC family permease [Vulcanisaeta souniana]|uniref:Amino acid transporter n=1 Tax=Vulcanisaeta souniana JCM 11219 TaxID=1293586 RepID=A0A830EK26_9CREN|nr:APC family permease [Vulcanisaeta souniana]BDR92666.1 amino acid transporter [Vulcanisaeta souniana JCM 11219]GGI84511.1 amino acid transporter [Vulcanisaeta souniana JCM 11219]
MARQESRELRRNAAGFLGSLYNSLAGQAPAYSIAGGAALIMGSAYAAAPLAMLLTLLGVLAVVYSIFVLARRYPHAASFYAYVTNTINARTGFVNGIVYTVFYSIVGVGSVAIAFAYLGTEGIYAVTGHVINPLILLPIPIVLALVPAILGIRPSVRTEMTLTSIEIAVLLVFVILSFAANANRLSLIPFTVQGTFATTPTGVMAALSGGLIFAITYFMGFEVSTQISEEVRDPRKSVPTSTLWATVFMGILYILVTYAILLNIGYTQSAIGNFVSMAEGMGPNPVYTLIGHYLGTPGLVLFAVSVMISVFGCYLATLNATARMLYGMARDGLLPTWLAETHPRYKSPHKALYMGTAVAILTIVLAYMAAYVSGYVKPLELTYNAMEDAYAIDSLYYVLSLILVAAGALRLTTWGGRVAIGIGIAILAITFYYSITSTWYLAILVASIVLTVAVSYAINPRIRKIKVTACPYC